MPNIVFSIIINCKNSEEYLEISIQSVLNQSYKNFELIIVDNNSIDKTKVISESFDDKRLRYFNTKKNLNLGEARNFGIEKAKGKYIGFLDSDDYWNKNKLEKTLNQFNNENVVFVYSNVNYFNDISNSKLYSNEFPFSKNIYNDLLKNYNLCISSCIINSLYLSQLTHLFDKNLEVCEDFDFFIRLSSMGNVNYINDVLVNYRIHSNNLTKTKRFLFFEEKNLIIKKLNSSLDIEPTLYNRLLCQNDLDKSKYLWKINKNHDAINQIFNSRFLKYSYKIFYSILFLFNYNFIKKIYSFFKNKKIDIDI